MGTDMAYKTIEKHGGLYIARREGDVIKLSIPGQTYNDWRREGDFLDLPMMDKETFSDMVDALTEMKELFE
jgi:hypothetical protein